MIEKISDNVILIMMILMILLSIIVQIMIGVLYQKLIEETENMELIRYKKLGRFKEKFTKFYQLNNNINNIPVSVEKFLNKSKIWGLSLNAYNHIAGQFMLLSVFFAGIGICKGIIIGKTVGQLIPYLAISIFGLYLYFSIATILNLEERSNMLRTNMIDYLENQKNKQRLEERRKEKLNDYISLEAESENPRRKEIRVFQDNLLTNNTDRLVEKEIQESFKKETQKLTEDEINKKNQEDSNKRTEIKQNKEEDERELEELLETLFYGAI